MKIEDHLNSFQVFEFVLDMLSTVDLSICYIIQIILQSYNSHISVYIK